jgi:acetyltransferase
MLAQPPPFHGLQLRGFVLRPIQPGDGGALQGYFRRLSPEARYFRPLGAAKELPASELARSLAADGVETLTLLFVHRTVDRETIVGEARAAFSRAVREGEFAMSIAEGWRRLGLGAALLAGIERLAMDGGVNCLAGDVLRDNAGMIALARNRGFRLETGLEGRLVRVAKRFPH